MNLILASSSPQRKNLLDGLRLPFTVVCSRINEEGELEKDPVRRAQHLARLKAQDVHAKHPNSVVIGCDTLVVASDSTLLEKPKDETEARIMLDHHSGKTSVVHSAVCVIDTKGNLHEGMDSSSVTFATLNEEDKDWWISTNLWQGRSGGFQVDGLGQMLISHIEGDWTGIVGLPIYLVSTLLKKAGINLKR